MRFRKPGTPVTPEQMIIRELVWAQITDKPESLDMGDWERPSEGLLDSDKCETTRCLGGWAQWFYRGYVDLATTEEDAVEAMGLSWEEYYPPSLGVRLFYCHEGEAVEQMRRLARAG